MININEDLLRSIAFGTIENVKNNLNDGADPNYNPRGTPPLFLSLYENKMDIFDLLMEHSDININIQNIMGNTIFIECLSQDLDDITKKLIDNEIIMSQFNSKGEYPLHQAINYQKTNIVNEILGKYPEYINIRDSMGNTPLIIASKIGDESLIKVILEYSPDLTIKNKFDKDALYYLERKSLDGLVTLNSISEKINILRTKNDIIDDNKKENLGTNEDKGLSSIKKRRNK